MQMERFNYKPLADNDKLYLLRAIELSNKGDRPYGALLRLDNGTVFEALNTVNSSGDPTRHAEMTLFSELFSQDVNRVELQAKT